MLVAQERYTTATASYLSFLSLMDSRKSELLDPPPGAHANQANFALTFGRSQQSQSRASVSHNVCPIKGHNAAVRAAGSVQRSRRTSGATPWQRGSYSAARPLESAQFLAMSLETLLRVYCHHRADDSADVHRGSGPYSPASRIVPNVTCGQTCGGFGTKAKKVWSE
jgi:hypothetical protein